MLAADRRYRILERVAEEQAIHVGELAADLGVSEMTIRRDIRRLERDGFLRRTYGGATAHVTRSLELAFNARALQHATAKRLIGVEAARLVGDARTLFLGIGTTVEQLALFLPRRPDLTVVTGSLPVASLLGTREGRVIALGGAVRSNELSCYGPVAMATVARYHADLAILGAAGVSARRGVSEMYDEEAELHHMMIERSERVMILADGSKLGEVAQSVVCPIQSVDLLVTDESAPADELDALRAAGWQVAIARRVSQRDDGDVEEMARARQERGVK